jgi:prevent-host-death family protein
MSTASLFDAKTHLSALIAELERTREPVTITRHGKPVARLVPIDPPPAPADLLADLRRRVREQGLVYDPAGLCEPLPVEAWGELAGPGLSGPGQPAAPGSGPSA